MPETIFKRRSKPAPPAGARGGRARLDAAKPAVRGPARAAPGATRGHRAASSQRHLDLIGLGLIAAAVYLGFVLYLGWDGGRSGGWLTSGLANAFGAGRLRVPDRARRAGAAR